MDMTGEYRIPAPIGRVWAGLNDPEILGQSITGCDEIERTSDTEFVAKVTAKVGPVKARFAGKVTLSDIDPPNGYKISGEGTGGAAGFAKGGASVRLAEDGTDTVLSYTVNASVGGKLAQIGSRLIDATARKMADDFFGKFADLVSTPIETVAELPEAPVALDETRAAAAGLTVEEVARAASTIPLEATTTDSRESDPAPAMAPPEGAPVPRSLPPYAWIIGVVVIAGLVLWYFAT